MSKHNTIESSITFLMLLTLLVSLSTNPVLAQVNDVAITNVTKSNSIIGQGFNMDINVTAANLGGFPETFNVTLNGTRTIVTTIKLNLYGSAIQGWGLTPSTISSPGPIISVGQGDLVNLT